MGPALSPKLFRRAKGSSKIRLAISRPLLETGTPNYSVDTLKALPILFAHKIQDARLQHLLVQGMYLLLSLLGLGVCGFILAPTFWTIGVFAPCLFLFGLFLSIGVGDLFLKFAMEDRLFFDLATKKRALSVFEDDDRSLPQPGY
jgi:hypothetical protein